MTSLTDFLGQTEPGRLTPAQRRLIVEQALLLLEQNYALLPFKVARYGINPLQRLRLLLQRLGRDGDPELEWRMHRELLDVFNSLRDLHTRYTLPQPFNGVAVFLPFLLKEFTEDGRRRYLVSRRQAGQPDLGDEAFRFGVEVTHWNGVPIARAIERFGEGLPGANADARHARAVQMFTVRSLAFAAPPDEEWITLGYLDDDRKPREIRLTWSATPIETATAAVADTPLGVDVEGAQLARLRAELFAPAALAGRAAAPGPEVVPVSPELTTVFEARRVTVGGRTVGHLRIRTFMPTAGGIVAFVQEFARLLAVLPPDGLVLDVRGNGGGAVVASELCLQALTAKPVEPEPAQFAVTALNLRMCRTNDSLRPWLKSMEQSLESGAPYSAGVPFTEREWFEAVPQSYFGPVVLLTDARCYSATDIFAAGFQDNGIGRVLGTDGNTGAGGGNVWQLGDLIGALAGQSEVPYKALPLGAGLSLVIRRVLRVAANAGTPLEDYGVVPDERHLSTRRDIVEDDADLLAAAVKLLDKSPPRRFEVELSEVEGSITATFGVLGIDRADFEVDGRPRYSADLGGNPGPIEVVNCGGAAVVRIRGFDAGELVALRTFVRRGETLQPLETLAD
ncbi:S41 family peptidase [Actinoplanes sp. TRM 88003]|uniref:S41 family peptidase n=1 Tax=Paractinoplanes aksuensis TaxID=2939490 RepID=A0ABT1DJM4_9ACTN|nr:S41 family peptidase [Actinoplanes aksuensis]MCO8271039.1 S41 family peptidase [Actinoplanes aksuensis]